MTAPAADDARNEVSLGEAEGRTHSICPYLAAADGSWRSITPLRDHRCAAVDPPAPIATLKQRELCLVAAHVQCPTYRAAIEAVDAGAASGRLRAAARFPIPRTTPVVLERGRPTLAPAVVARQRGIAQGVLLGLMAIALVAILLARFGDRGGGSGAAAASASPPAEASSLAPTPRPTPSPRPSPSPSASPSPAPSSAASSRPSASPRHTYVVKAGDNLSAIAARNGTTTKVLVDLNGIKNPSVIHVGQVLILP